jgi:hypothetical protein
MEEAGRGARRAWRPEAGNDAPKAPSADSRAAAHPSRSGRKSAWDASIALTKPLNLLD